MSHVVTVLQVNVKQKLLPKVWWVHKRGRGSGCCRKMCNVSRGWLEVNM